MKRRLWVLCALMALVENLPAGTVTGTIAVGSSGLGVSNGTLTFTLSQPALLAGSFTAATSPGYCYTDSGGTAGAVVGQPNPLVIPVASTNIGAGSLAGGTYYVKITYVDATGETQASPEATVTLSATGTLIVTAPVRQPASATGYNVYISSTKGAETLQGSITGTPGTWANYSRAVALVNGVVPPAANSTQCKLHFNDEFIPSYTYYSVNLTNQSGSQIAGFPQKWYVAGGAAGTINLSNGTPLFAGVVQYPQAIVANPPSNSLQIINGPLTVLGNFSASTINNIFIVNGITYATLHAAATAACANGGGRIYLPLSSYQENAPVILCSNLTIEGAGRAQADVVACPTTVNTNITSGDLFTATDVDFDRLADFCIQNIGAGGGTALHLSGARFGYYERLYIAGPFSNDITVNVGAHSAIWNHFVDVHTTGLQAGGVGCLLDSGASVSQVINNNIFDLTNCTGGTGGVAFKTAGGSAGNSYVNENTFRSGQLTATAGTGLLVTGGATGSTRNLVVQGATIEGSATGVNLQAGNSGFTLLGGEVSANGVNFTSTAGVTDRTFITANIGAALQNFGVDQVGNLRSNSLSFGTAAATGNHLNGPPGTVLEAVGGGHITLNSTDITLAQQLKVNANALTQCSAGNYATGVNSILDAVCVALPLSGITAVRTVSGGATCTTGANSYDVCTSTYSWNSTFADANYSASCSGIGNSNAVVLSVASKTASQVTVQVQTQRAAAGQFSNVDCVGIHP